MVQFRGYEELISKVYDAENGHVFTFWDELSEKEKLTLLADLEKVDFREITRLMSGDLYADEQEFSPAPGITLAESGPFASRSEAFTAGEEYIASGRVAAFVVAGGQGSRLGFDGPKGMFPAGPVSGSTLFEIFAAGIKKSSEKYGVVIPWLIMTSMENRSDIESYFSENDYFGLGKSNIYMFSQKQVPSLTLDGKLILASKNSLFRNPDGHGGSLTALRDSGLLDELKSRGIDTISYFQVDNPLVRVIDPFFIGLHAGSGAEVSSKYIEKTDPDEKVGIFVRFSRGRAGVVEYSDLTPESAVAVGEDGRLLYCAANIAVHLFDRKFIERITSEGDAGLKYHRAAKIIECLQPDGSIAEIKGYKFEKFVFDALPLTDKNLLVETVREEEFAPIKNADGKDSPASSRKLMTGLHRQWLQKRGIVIPAGVREIEISPLLAAGPEDIDPSLQLPDQEKVYIRP